MGVLKKIAKGPKLLRPLNPVAAVLGAKKHGGSILKAALDPAGVIHKKNVTSGKAAEKKEYNSPEASKKRRTMGHYEAAGMAPPPGMKKGGQVNCRGAGAATRGTRFGGKD